VAIGLPQRHGLSTLHRALAIQQNIFLHLFATKVRKRMVRFSATWYLGTLTFGTFLILVITGILLMLYYHPSVPQAYADMKDLQFVVSSGLFLRNLHRWSAQLMVFLVFAHMFKVFYRGAYARRANSTGSSASFCCSSRCCSATPAICFPGTSLPSGPSPSAPIFLPRCRWWAARFTSCCWAATRSTPTRCCAFMCCTASFCRWRPFSSSPSISGAFARTAASTCSSRSPKRKQP
jgi:hypothetical protein